MGIIFGIRVEARTPDPEESVKCDLDQIDWTLFRKPWTSKVVPFNPTLKPTPRATVSKAEIKKPPEISPLPYRIS